MRLLLNLYHKLQYSFMPQAYEWWFPLITVTQYISFPISCYCNINFVIWIIIKQNKSWRYTFISMKNSQLTKLHHKLLITIKNILTVLWRKRKVICSGKKNSYSCHAVQRQQDLHLSTHLHLWSQLKSQYSAPLKTQVINGKGRHM